MSQSVHSQLVKGELRLGKTFSGSVPTRCSLRIPSNSISSSDSGVSRLSVRIQTRIAGIPPPLEISQRVGPLHGCQKARVHFTASLAAPDRRRPGGQRSALPAAAHTDPWPLWPPGQMGTADPVPLAGDAQEAPRASGTAGPFPSFDRPRRPLGDPDGASAQDSGPRPRVGRVRRAAEPSRGSTRLHIAVLFQRARRSI